MCLLVPILFGLAYYKPLTTLSSGAQNCRKKDRGQPDFCSFVDNLLFLFRFYKAFDYVLNLQL